MYNALPPPGEEIAVYGRYSDLGQNPSSVEDQHTLCRKFAERFGWAVAYALGDEARTGSSMRNRPGIAEIIQLAREKKFRLLIAETQDRFSRKQADTHAFFDELWALGVTVVTVQEGPLDRLKVTFLGFKAQQDLEQNRERIQRGFAGVLEDERFLGSIAYGLRKKLDPENPKNGLREINPKTSRHVVWGFMQFAAGARVQWICDELNNRGVPSPKGKRWQPSTWYGCEKFGTGVFRNEVLCGIYTFGKTRRVFDHAKQRVIVQPGDKSDQVTRHVPELQIIADDLWAAVQARLAENAEAAPEQKLHERRRCDYVFSGLTRCGVCGEAYHVLNAKLGCTGRHLKATGCTNTRRVAREDVEQAVFDALGLHLRHPELIEPYLAAYAEEEARLAAGSGTEVEDAKARLERAKKGIDNVTQKLVLTEGAGHAAKIMIAELERLEAERVAAERQVVRGSKPRKPAPASSEEVLAGFDRLIAQISGVINSDDLEAQHARDVMQSLIKEIRIEPEGPSKRRGSGAVRLTVIGRLTELIKLSQITLGREALTKCGTKLGQDLSNVVFRFTVVVQGEGDKLAQTKADRALIERMLDDADAPIRNHEFVAAILKDGEADEAASETAERRVRNVTVAMAKEDRIRSLRLDLQIGWVWNHRAYTDDQWRARAARPKPKGYPMPIIRMVAPQAIVTVIGGSVHVTA